MRFDVTVTVQQDDKIMMGHRPGIIRIGPATIYMEDTLFKDGGTLLLELLRDECERQIEAVAAARVQARQEPLPANAPAEELAAPWIAPPPSPANYIAGMDRAAEEGIALATIRENDKYMGVVITPSGICGVCGLDHEPPPCEEKVIVLGEFPDVPF